MTEEAIKLIHESLNLHPDFQYKIAISLMAFIVVWLLRVIILKISLPRIKHLRNRYMWRKSSGYIASLIIVLVIGRIWFEGFQSITTFVGLISAALTIALKDLVINVAGWSFIILRRPFEVGDRVQLGEHVGDVIDVRIFQFTLLEVGNWVDADQSTGRVIHIPNGRIFTEPQANYNKGFKYIWTEIPVLITFESDWQKAKNILVKLMDQHAEDISKNAEQRIREAAHKYMISYTKLTPTVYTSVRDCGVLLTMRYLCDPRQRRNSEQKIWEEVLASFSKHEDIDFAYPTQRFYNNMTEGKQAIKGIE